MSLIGMFRAAMGLLYFSLNRVEKDLTQKVMNKRFQNVFFFGEWRKSYLRLITDLVNGNRSQAECIIADAASFYENTGGPILLEGSLQLLIYHPLNVNNCCLSFDCVHLTV